MTETLSIRLDAAYVEQEARQFGEIHAAIEELDSGKAVSHEKAAAWLKFLGNRRGEESSAMKAV